LQQRGITEVALETGRSGQFDVIVDGQLKYSRYSTGTFPSDQEVDGLAAG
jgi:predicted Rdx family selenoprotein